MGTRTMYISVNGIDLAITFNYDSDDGYKITNICGNVTGYILDCQYCKDDIITALEEKREQDKQEDELDSQIPF